MNVVVVVLDDPAFDSVDFMPNLAALDPIVFPNGIVTSPVCAISRASILTGRYASHHGVQSSNGLNTPNSQTFAVPLAAAGWDVSLVGKYNNGYPWGNGATWQPPGWTDWHGLSVAEYYDYTLVENGVANVFGSDPEDYLTDVLNDRAVTFVQNATEPFCLYLAHYAPHGSIIPADAYDGLYAAEPVPLAPNHNEADITDKPTWLRTEYPTPRTVGQLNTFATNRRRTWEAVRSVDDGIDAIHDVLVSRGIEDDTAIIVIADNSNFHGEHRLTSKGAPYEENLALTMRVVWPGQAPRTETAMVANIDIAPTLCDLAGVHMPVAPDGMSMVPLIEGTVANWRRDLMLEWFSTTTTNNGCPKFEAIRQADRKWVEYDDGTGDREFYDLTTDPYELANDAAGGARGLDVLLDRLRAG